ncbi:hypothetical protein AVEN_241556-1 [Araneus ventricosus]|uniref:Uncharacterized protein n=1 Tax=Araneus ventricosus TaxID=182803 RepID=A0A4Y2LPF2_ARAVE|nr:hypothetical protein AVEN_78017-1 [Araneus ventricosus]GBN16271.1 hypothetical protein AVEN_80215-1 [Araneus ventricosus]GBN16602.1 hypothetical protein AVEN_217059-1 [Araneus ventricosus]GBN16608.1 hypothetical protein AVEN_241556-1 [Araneus ventricosus]
MPNGVEMTYKTFHQHYYPPWQWKFKWDASIPSHPPLPDLGLQTCNSVILLTEPQIKTCQYLTLPPHKTELMFKLGYNLCPANGILSVLFSKLKKTIREQRF